MFKRSKTKKKFPGFWSLPGGHIEEGEDPLKTAIREVKEETGLNIAPNIIRLKIVALHHHIDRKETYITFGFVAMIKEKASLNNQTEEGTSHWVKKSEMFHKKNVFEPIKYYFNHVLNNHKGVLYNMSEWKDAKLVRVYSETIDQNL